jgi:hypothetical protein
MGASWPGQPNLGSTRRSPSFCLSATTSFLCLAFPRAEPFSWFRIYFFRKYWRPSHSVSPVYRLVFSFSRIMVALDSILRVSTIFVALDTALASHQTLVRRAIDNLHLEAARRTHSLAKDLRLAFGGIFPRAVSSSQPGHVVYCKPARQVPLSAGSGGGSEYNSTSTSMSIIGTRSRPTSTKTGTSPSPTVTSSWNLIDSHVRILFVPYILIFRQSYTTSAEWVEFLRWLGFQHRRRSDAWFVPFFPYR